MKNKTLFTLVILTILAALALAACSQGTPTPPATLTPIVTVTKSPLLGPNGEVVASEMAPATNDEAAPPTMNDVTDDIVNALPPWLVQLATAIWAMFEVRFLVSHIGLNTIVAVAIALYTKTFEWEKLADFLLHKIAPYVLVYAGAAIFGEAIGAPGLATVVFAILEVKLLAALSENLKTVGVTLPARAV
ncbi:MAG: hypothetical protein GY832_11220 [Chloroflexi bacterium]|nr:hypothetical protein [Chloroflexota bacterium]